LDGKYGKQIGLITKELSSLDHQAEQLRKKLDVMDFDINKMESRVISAGVIRNSFKVVKEIYDHLTPDEKYDLIHLLVKNIVYYVETSTVGNGGKSGKIRMELWELSPMNPSTSFAESLKIHPN